MSQSRSASMVEAWANTLIGYVINIGVQELVFPWWGIHVTFAENLSIGLVFLVVSVVRSYVLRRWFNGLMVNAIKRVLG